MEDSGKGQRNRGGSAAEVRLASPWLQRRLTSHLHQPPLLSGSLSCLPVSAYLRTRSKLYLLFFPLLPGHLPGGPGERNSNPHLLRLAYQISHLRGRADLSSSTCRLKAPRLVREPRSRGQRSRKERLRRAQHSREPDVERVLRRGSSAVLREEAASDRLQVNLASPGTGLPSLFATGPSPTLFFSLTFFSSVSEEIELACVHGFYF